MMEVSGERRPGSGAQTLAATGATRGENFAAAGRGQTSAEAVTALAHQFAGLISPLHGWFSADQASCLLANVPGGNLPVELSLKSGGANRPHPEPFFGSK
jgi:hypothetical protein